ncbi:uncharacterized protein MONBRDRAFT_16555, partial [Monosiga brevicollis MX1]
RPLAVVGPESLRITEAMVHVLSNYDFVHAIPHTTRAPRRGERDGIDYFFVTSDEMEAGIQQHLFIEAGKYKDNMYGTSLAAIQEPASEGKIVILDTQLKAVQRLKLFGDIHPIVILLKPNNMVDLQCSLKPAGSTEE